MTADRSRRGVSSLRWPVLCALATVVAVLAMHGPSSDHMLLRPGTHGMHASAHEHMATTAEHAVVSAGAAAMQHAECVGTLRHDEALPQAASIVVHLGAPPALEHTAPTVGTAHLRGPPAPALERLCISRT